MAIRVTFVPSSRIPWSKKKFPERSSPLMENPSPSVTTLTKGPPGTSIPRVSSVNGSTRVLISMEEIPPLRVIPEMALIPEKSTATSKLPAIPRLSMTKAQLSLATVIRESEPDVISRRKPVIWRLMISPSAVVFFSMARVSQEISCPAISSVMSVPSILNPSWRVTGVPLLSMVLSVPVVLIRTLKLPVKSTSGILIPMVPSSRP